MDNKKQLAKIEKCMESSSLCAISRDYIDTFSLYGYPVDASGELVAISFIYDFMPDGYKIIRKKDITDVFCGAAERFLDKVIKNEHKDFKPELKNIKLSTMKALCDELMSSGQIVTLECEDFEENIVLIGKIASIDGNLVSIKTFDALGVWDKEISSVELDDITCITIDNSYVNIISKYLREK